MVIIKKEQPCGCYKKRNSPVVIIKKEQPCGCYAKRNSPVVVIKKGTALWLL